MIDCFDGIFAGHNWFAIFYCWWKVIAGIVHLYIFKSLDVIFDKVI